MKTFHEAEAQKRAQNKNMILDSNCGQWKEKHMPERALGFRSFTAAQISYCYRRAWQNNITIEESFFNYNKEIIITFNRNKKWKLRSKCFLDLFFVRIETWKKGKQ